MILAILSGGDWADASVEHLKVPPGRDPQYDAEMYPGYRETGKHLREWLRSEYGYTTPVPREVTIVSDEL